MITSGIDWLVEAGEITEEEGQRLLNFHHRSASKRLPEIATARQRHVGAELRQHYRKEPDNVVQSIFLAAMNIHMQSGTPRQEAEDANVAYIRRNYDADFTPLRG